MDCLAEEKEETKEKLSDAAKLFDKAAGTDYLMKIGDRKGGGKEWKVVFPMENFKHTLGLHKCESFKELSSRSCCDKLLRREVSDKEIDEIVSVRQTKDRIENFHKIKEMLSGGGYVMKSKNGRFRCDERTAGIEADYMLASEADGKRYAHLFLKETSGGILEPVTFIVHSNNKYIKNCTDRRNLLWVKELPKPDEKEVLTKDRIIKRQIKRKN